MIVTNEFNLPQSFVEACKSEYTPTPKRFSATTLLKGAREVLLSRRHSEETQQDCSDMVWLIFGTAVHKVLESTQAEGEVKEQFITWEAPNGYTVSGVFDLYDEEKATITDWKTASVNKVLMGDWDDYETQLKVYAYMLRQQGKPCEYGQIVALLKDHSKTKASLDSSYPPHPVFVKRFHFTDDDMDDIGLWIEHRLSELERLENVPDDELPVCDEHERWARPSKWAVTKKGNKKAARLCDTEEDAISKKAFYEDRDGKPYEITFRKGVDAKCENYCTVAPFCNYWKENCCE